jgi:hypothetical protein
MAEGEAGLELPIGLTEQKFLQQLARIEARAIKASKGMQQGFVKGNADVARSFGQMSNSARSNLQNVSFQLQDIFVQIAGGQGVVRSLGQQLPQLLGGFGALGAGIGIAVSAMPLLIGLLKDADEKTDDFKDTVSALEGALKSLTSAQQDLSTPVDDLIEKYRTLSGVMREAYEEQLKGAERALKKASGDVLTGLTEQINVGSQEASVAGYQQTIEAVGRALEQGIITQQEYNDRVAELGDRAAPTVSLLDQLKTTLETVASAESLEDYARAWADVRDFIEANRAALEESGIAVDDLINQANSLTIQFADANSAASEISGALEVASGAAAGLQTQMAGVAASARAAAAAIQLAAGTSFAAPSLDRFGNGEDITTRAGGLDRQEQQNFRYDWIKQMEEAAAASTKAARSSGGGGSRKRGGSGGGGSPSSSRAETPFFGDIEKDLLNLERQISLVGKSNEEVATAKARWELLDEAKKRGLPVNAELNAQIDAQAAQVGRLTAELEAAETSQQQFDDAIQGVADSMAGALLAGESLRDGLAQVFKQIAADIINSGIQNALSSQFSGGGLNIGGLLGGLFGGGDALSSALGAAGAPVRSFDGGGFTGMGGRSGGIDGKGGFPAILHPNETVVDHSRGQAAGSSAVNININVTGARGNAEIQEMVSSGVRQGLSSYDKALPTRVQSIQANPRKR